MLISDRSVDGKLIEDLTPSSERRVLAKCDKCGIVKELIYANYSRSQVKNGYNGLTYCRKCVTQFNGIKRRGKVPHNKGKKLKAEQKGVNHPSWKGGKYVDGNGYVMVYIGDNSSEIGWNSYRKEHTIVVEDFLNRKLAVDEVIHHIDGDKTENQIENLWLTDGVGHRKAHNSLQNIGYVLYKKGIIGFDKTQGFYFLKDNHENFESSEGLLGCSSSDC
jgi:hypothetical protein